MRLKFTFLGLLAVALIAVPLAAQSGYGRLTGSVADADGAGLPGVTISLASESLQGDRTLVTEGNGDFSSPPLPPGEYEVTFQLEGFQTITQRVRVSAAQTLPLEVTLDLATVQEEIVVTGEATQSISQTSTKASTLTTEELDGLPVGRAIGNAVALSPAVTTGVNGESISGAQSWDNLYMLNGVVLNENIRGQEFQLFIEDEIQETTVATGSISAEYGRFTGGVITAISKSGGNSFEGSFRTTFDNEDWKGDNDFSPEERQDVTNETFEATVGGRVIRDRLWFFGAGRDRETDDTATTQLLNISYPTGTAEERLSGKLTFGVTEKHQLQTAYTEIENDQFNVAHGGITGAAVTVDDGSIDPVRSLPQELTVFNYTGVLTPNFFVEGRVTEREFFFEGTGGSDQDLITGSPIWDLVNSVAFNESHFCDSEETGPIPLNGAVCIPEERSNETWFAKGSYFLAGDAGSHDIAFGAESFTDIRASDNHQSPTDVWVLNLAETVIVDGEVFPPLIPGATTFRYSPVLNPSQGTDIVTDSAFVNDSWRVNDRLSVNLGVRYDSIDAVNSLKLKVADSDMISPRIGASYDLRGDGEHVLHGFIGRYSGAAANGPFDDTSPAGNPAFFWYLYTGAETGLFDPTTFNTKLFGWFDSVCPNGFEDPFSCPALIGFNIPGATSVLAEDLRSPGANEISLGYQTNVGTRGIFRVDATAREFDEFLADTVNLGNGQGVDPNGNPFDLSVVLNEDNLNQRDYYGLTAMTRLNFLDGDLRVGANATVSHLYGNINGETSGSGAISEGGPLVYPEYKEGRWNDPVGDLSNDQRYRARVWATYDIFRNDRHGVSVGGLQSFFSGQPYSATGTIETQPFVTNPGYITPPTDLDYFFGGRGEFTTDDVMTTDLQLNYNVNFGRFELFVIPSVTNVFNQDAVIDVNTAVTTRNSGGEASGLVEFNPFTETPVEGTHWRKGDNFGQPLEEDDLQSVRQFRISAGFRWNPR